MNEQSTVIVGHLTDTSPAFGFIWVGEERRYRTTAFQVRRPAEGKTLLELRCEECDAELLLRVRSRAWSRMIRRRYQITAAIGLAIAAVTIAVVVGLEEVGVSIPLDTALGVITIVGPLLSLAGFGIGVYGWLHENAVRLYSGTGRTDETHRLLFGGTEPHDAAG
jgi:hypothetical protein